MENNFLQLVHEERMRQIDEKHYMPRHDDKYTYELSRAAAAYALAEFDRSNFNPQFGFLGDEKPSPVWPWNKAFWKPEPNNRKRELIKAAALLFADFDRISRLEEDLQQI